MSKKIYLKDSQELLLEGINLYADAVKSTLGPSGKFVIINNCNGEEIDITKDGVTVGNSIDHDDPVINTGIQLIKKVASKTDVDNGDGTTSATVWCRELIKLGMDINQKEDFNHNDFRLSIQNELNILVENLKKIAVEISLDDINKIAYTSSNNDPEIANLFQIAFNNAKKDGYINIVKGPESYCSVDIISGYVIELGYLDRQYANNFVSGFFEAHAAAVLIYDNEFTDRKEMVKLIQRRTSIDQPIMIFAKDFSKEVRSIVDHNNSHIQTNKICLLKNELRNDEYANFIEDLAMYTFAEPVKNFDEFNTEFGIGYNVVVKQGYTVFGKLEHYKIEVLNKYIETLKEAADQEKSLAYQTSIYRRIDRMENGITTFYVGGNSDIEIKEKLDRVNDAYRACKLALKGKVVIGGGQSLFLLSRDLNECDEYQLVFSLAIRKTFLEILKNSFHDSETISSIKNIISLKIGYNAKTRKFENLMESGIVDPVDVIINGLTNAVSVALIILSTECLIVETQNQ